MQQQLRKRGHRRLYDGADRVLVDLLDGLLQNIIQIHNILQEVRDLLGDGRDGLLAGLDDVSLDLAEAEAAQQRAQDRRRVHRAVVLEARDGLGEGGRSGTGLVLALLVREQLLQRVERVVQQLHDDRERRVRQVRNLLDTALDALGQRELVTKVDQGIELLEPVDHALERRDGRGGARQIAPDLGLVLAARELLDGRVAVLLEQADDLLERADDRGENGGNGFLREGRRDARNDGVRVAGDLLTRLLRDLVLRSDNLVHVGLELALDRRAGLVRRSRGCGPRRRHGGVNGAANDRLQLVDGHDAQLGDGDLLLQRAKDFVKDVTLKLINDQIGQLLALGAVVAGGAEAASPRGRGERLSERGVADGVGVRERAGLLGTEAQGGQPVQLRLLAVELQEPVAATLLKQASRVRREALLAECTDLDLKLLRELLDALGQR
eukprot:m.220977 g.220977  ORF g.220977 m.220977 type:complete len:438 (+) comp10487_c0_seq1:51-1364(+)